jgi:hypothetical protein
LDTRRYAFVRSLTLSKHYRLPEHQRKLTTRVHRDAARDDIVRCRRLVALMELEVGVKIERSDDVGEAMLGMRFGVKSRIYGGLAVLVVPGLVPAPFAVWQLCAIKTSVDRPSGISGNDTRMLEVQRDVEMLQRATLRFNNDGGEVALRIWTDTATHATDCSVRQKPTPPRPGARYTAVNKFLMTVRAA